jgi:alpha-galactosidase
MRLTLFASLLAVTSGLAAVPAADFAPAPAGRAPEIRTPPAPATPRINGPSVFGVRPKHPLLYHIPVTGDRPMEYAADSLPAGLTLDTKSGDITGELDQPGEYRVRLQAKNSLGTDQKEWQIIVGETVALTPPMGWNSWNHFKGAVSQALVLQTARAMVDSGLINHGWTYINIDDTWQGERGGPFHALQGNKKFPDLKQLCDQVHALGLKLGIYSTPWTTSYAAYPGGSAENAAGDWTKPVMKKSAVNRKILPWAIGRYSFARNDARQFAAWGIDYLKYDWYPIAVPETREMAEALRASGRDIVYSLSNNLKPADAPAVTPLANCWRTTGDISANWHSMSSHGFGQVSWRPFSGPGHWNDPDMLEIGTRENKQPGLTPDEEYTHMTLWCLVCSPLLLGNDLTHMSPFTLNLLENDEVIAVNQDALGDQAVAVASVGDTRVYAKKMADGSQAVGLFNLDDQAVANVTVKWSDLHLEGAATVRDLWRQKNLGQFTNEFTLPVAPHSAELVKITP